ncbi:MAG TPA: ATPase [Lachnospiraceae bacterium]|nr:ATPase [Lachnospiraceae bacterium]
MIEKMQFLTITGPKDDIDRVMELYLSKHEIHLENALSELSSVHDLKPFVEINPYKDVLVKADSLVEKLGDSSRIATHDMTMSEAQTVVEQAFLAVEDLSSDRKKLTDEKEALSKALATIEPFRMLDYDLKKILNFKFLKFRFGKISHEYYTKFSNYVYETLNTVFIECDRDEHYVWGVYFVPASSSAQVDAVFTSLHFDRIYMPAEYEGTPEEIYQSLLTKQKELRVARRKLTETIQARLLEVAPELTLAHQKLKEFSNNFEIRKLAACTKETNQGIVFYILCGWMTKKDAKKFLKEIDADPNVYCICEDEHESACSKPPTKLKNPKIFKPFELFIQMYGLPAYNEMDPTIFVALTYTLIFGIMFGDVGQGALLMIGGFLLYKFKKMNLAAIISVAGIWSTIFGFLYGSIFGFEEVLEAVWRRPMDDIMTTLIMAICFGIFLILVAMILNIINGIRAKNIEKIFFDASGVAGFVCYGSVVGCVALYFFGYPVPGTIVLAILVGLPLLCIFLKEPLSNWIEKRKDIFPEGSKAMFFVENLVELFDVVLSYATNTISFVRVGAFALSHAGMMGVVLSLAHVESGSPNILVIILGNLVVMVLEGLVVGIQVLRLEYYEMFSRFYRGTGKAFKPFKSKETN